MVPAGKVFFQVRVSPPRGEARMDLENRWIGLAAVGNRAVLAALVRVSSRLRMDWMFCRAGFPAEIQGRQPPAARILQQTKAIFPMNFGKMCGNFVLAACAFQCARRKHRKILTFWKEAPDIGCIACSFGSPCVFLPNNLTLKNTIIKLIKY